MIRAAIVATLKAVPGIGEVYGYERFAQQEKAFRELYSSSGKLLGWHVRRMTRREISIAIGVNQAIDGWRIVGMSAIDDANASEIAMDVLVDAVSAKFRDDETLGGAVLHISDMTRSDRTEMGIQLEESGPVMFSGVLCHRVRLGLTTTSIIQY